MLNSFPSNPSVLWKRSYHRYALPTRRRNHSNNEVDCNQTLTSVLRATALLAIDLPNFAWVVLRQPTNDEWPSCHEFFPVS